MDDFWVIAGVLREGTSDADARPLCPVCGQIVDTASVLAVLHHAALGHRRMVEPEPVVLSLIEPVPPLNGAWPAG
jgi:hypothetical protein